MANIAALLAGADDSGFQYSNDLWLAFARLAAAPAEDSVLVTPTVGNEGRSRGLAYRREVAAPRRT